MLYLGFWHKMHDLFSFHPRICRTYCIYAGLRYNCGYSTAKDGAGISPRAVHKRSISALLLLVLGILANDHDAALALDDLALLANGLNGRSHFHVDSTSYLHRIAPAVQPFG